MYGDPGAGLVDVVVLDPRHGLQTDGYRLAGQSLQLAHLEQSQVRAGTLVVSLYSSRYFPITHY